MEDSRFDSLSRVVASGLSRRRALGVAIAAILGSANLGADDATASRSCREGGRQCTRHGQCCTGNCMRVGTSGSRPRFICSCPRGLVLCNNRCVNLDDDPRNCGACGRRCKSGERCCNGACVQLGTKDHCGSCGDRCLGDASCISGACLSVCVEGPGVDACCNNMPTQLGTGTDTDCDGCADDCPAGEACFALPRNQDGSFAGAACCDCTDRCGTYCDGLCPDCSADKICDSTTNTCEEPGICSGIPTQNVYYVSTDTPPVFYAGFDKEDASPWWYNQPVEIVLKHECTVSSDCTANCPSTISHSEGYQADGCFCARSLCEGASNGDGTDQSGAAYTSEGGVAGKYYCWLHLKKP